MSLPTTTVAATAAAVLVLLAASLAAYSAALVAVDRGEIARRAASGRRSALVVERSLERLGFELAGLRLGVLVCTLGVGALVEPLVDAMVGSRPGVMSEPNRGWTVLASLAVAVGLQVVAGEMVARSIGAQRPVGTSLALAGPARAVVASVAPLVGMGDVVARRVVARSDADTTDAETSARSRDELRRLVHLSEVSGAIRASDAELFDRTLRFGDKVAADAITPRVEVESLSLTSTVGDLADRSSSTGYSRFPVHDDDLDHVVGIVHVKDVLGVPRDERRTRPLRELLRPVLAVPETKDLDSLMAELRDADGQFAVVVDEYGGTAGIITLEDVIEEIVGDIADEHDPALARPTVRRWGGAHLLAGSLHADEVQEACGFTVPDGDYDTIAGFVMDRLGRVPAEGDQFDHDGWALEVVEVEGNRLRTVKLVAPSPGAHGLDDVDPTGSTG